MYLIGKLTINKLLSGIIFYFGQNVAVLYKKYSPIPNFRLHGFVLTTIDHNGIEKIFKEIQDYFLSNRCLR